MRCGIVVCFEDRVANELASGCTVWHQKYAEALYRMRRQLRPFVERLLPLWRRYSMNLGKAYICNGEMDFIDMIYTDVIDGPSMSSNGNKTFCHDCSIIETTWSDSNDISAVKDCHCCYTFSLVLIWNKQSTVALTLWLSSKALSLPMKKFLTELSHGFLGSYPCRVFD